jgi:hypothetical protein
MRRKKHESFAYRSVEQVLKSLATQNVDGKSVADLVVNK